MIRHKDRDEMKVDGPQNTRRRSDHLIIYSVESNPSFFIILLQSFYVFGPPIYQDGSILICFYVDHFHGTNFQKYKYNEYSGFLRILFHQNFLGIDDCKQGSFQWKYFGQISSLTLFILTKKGRWLVAAYTGIYGRPNRWIKVYDYL